MGSFCYANQNHVSSIIYPLMKLINKFKKKTNTERAAYLPELLSTAAPK